MTLIVPRREPIEGKPEHKKTLVLSKSSQNPHRFRRTCAAP